MATYVDVCLLGVLEERIELLLRQRAWKPNDKYIANYIEGDLRQSFKNPKRGKICEVLGKFGPDLADAFRAKFSPTCSEINALESINSIKNNLAHVGAYDLKLTLQDVEDYFNRVVPILEVLESILS
ncbi:MAG: hypothetical protein Q7T26_06630 [Dehalococcoidia bacterium]|nr:hypothetical protein [Dehalococcoidia bacterium]